MSSFIVRVRTSKGMKRLLFESASDATWFDLQAQLRHSLGLTPDYPVLLSLTAPPDVCYIEKKEDSSLKSVGLVHGQMLYLAPEAPKMDTSSSSSSSSSTARKIYRGPTSRCTHGFNGRCIHCDGVRPGEPVKLQKRACQHPPNQHCINCLDQVASSTASSAADMWCSHPETAFCVNCAPKEADVDDETLRHRVISIKCDCDKSKGQRCTRCSGQEAQTVIKVDKIPYRQFLMRRRRDCKYKHGVTDHCASCTDPEFPSYAGKTDCDRGHRPWPYGVCLSCAPPVANIRPQAYRHCDGVALPPQPVQRFYREWAKRGGYNARAAILLGYYMDEPAETKNEGAVRCVVEAIYEPPQEGTPEGVRFLKDNNEKLTHQVAEGLGLEVVGWIIATLPRFGDKYGGKVILSGRETLQAASFQRRYRSQKGHSRFVTVVLEQQDNIEPVAYQVSDQCVAMYRDGLIDKSPKDVNMLVSKEETDNKQQPFASKKKKIANKIVYKNVELEAKREFLPDDFIVKVIVMGSNDPVLSHSEFPGIVELISQPANAGAMAKAYMSKHSSEAYHTRLSDFNFLLYISKLINDEDVMKDVLESVRAKQEPSQRAHEVLDNLVVSQGWI